jgi:hypothetical protein
MDGRGRPAKEGLRRRDTAIGAQQEMDGIAMLVHGTKEIVPFGLNRYGGIIHSPEGANRLGEPSPALLELRDVARYPAEDRGVGNLDAALCHHLHQIVIREPVGDIPSHAQLNDVGVKGALAVHWVTDYRLGHSAPRAVNSAVYPIPRDAPEPSIITVSAMPQNKKHHYVPKFYLKRFSTDERRINLYNLRSGRTVIGGKLKGQCARDYFYGTELNVERALGVAEGEAAEVFRLVDKYQAPPPYGSPWHMTLVVHILMQSARTKYAADAVNEVMDKMAKQILKGSKKLEGIDLSKFKVSMKEPARYSLGVSAETYPIALDLRCKLLCNQTDEEFVTSDNPVVLYNQFFSFRNFGSNCGTASKGLQIFFPLDAKKQIVLYDDAVYRFGGERHTYIDITAKHDVYELNTLQMCSASENIYFTGSSFDAQALHKKALPFLREQKARVGVVSREETKSGISELVATSAEDVRTNLTLSFSSIRQSAKAWRHKFRKLKEQPVVVVRDERIMSDFRKFREAVKLGERNPEGFAGWLSQRNSGTD